MIVREQAMMVLVPKFVDSPPFLYFLGSLRVLIGLPIVLAHNIGSGRWGQSYMWGWLTLLRGIAMLLLPAETERKILRFFHVATYGTSRRASRSCLAVGSPTPGSSRHKLAGAM